jgi:hypothetical protein
MTANELITDLKFQSSQMEYGYAVSDWKLLSDSAIMLRQQQAEIEALKKELERYADAIGEERGNKALRNDEITKILAKVLDDCGLLKKANEK